MIKNILLDIDGLLIVGGKVVKGSKEAIGFLEKNNYNYLLVSNVTRITAEELEKSFSKNGINIKEEKMLLPMGATIQYVKSKKMGAKCFLIATPSAKNEFKKSGIILVEKEKPVDFVVVFFDDKTNYKKLDIAFRLILNGAELVTNSPNKTFPNAKGGKPALASGVFARLLEYASGKTATTVGKPQKEFFEAALYKLNAKPEETMMIGDSIETDILGAKNTGIKAVLVKTGNFKPEALEKSVLKPDYVIESVADLPALLEKERRQNNV
ncbi:MAG: HAD-IIA family hydrolase [Candidatus Diapherotrites archaeon]|nr:HAD-IIA family hydrolase [Candidatus Diapherotrites archaeon]